MRGMSAIACYRFSLASEGCPFPFGLFEICLSKLIHENATVMWVAIDVRKRYEGEEAEKLTKTTTITTVITTTMTMNSDNNDDHYDNDNHDNIQYRCMTRGLVIWKQLDWKLLSQRVRVVVFNTNPFQLDILSHISNFCPLSSSWLFEIFGKMLSLTGQTGWIVWALNS